MGRILFSMLCAFTAVALLWTGCANADQTQASAEQLDTRHRISIKLGVHDFFPDTDEHEGTKPDNDGVVTEDEWQYIWEEAYQIQDFDGATIELGYEYLFLRWFGLALDMGIYGGERKYDFTVSGFDVKTYMKIDVFHFDVMPRFHWTTRRTDFYGGPALGYYTASVKFNIDSKYGDYSASMDGEDKGDGLGWGVFAGFEFRISKHFGLSIEDRLTIAIIDEFKPEKGEEPANVGGNILTLAGVIHL